MSDEKEQLHLIGLAYIKEGELEKAQQCFEKALKIDPEDPALNLHLANVLKARGQWQAAIVCLLTLLKHHPQFAAAFNNLGTVYFAQEKYEQAINAYQHAIALRSDYDDAYYNLGLAMSRLHREVEAKAAYDAILKQHPAHQGAHFQLACLLIKEGCYQAAINHFSMVEDANPAYVASLANIALCYLKIGKLADAVSYYLKVLAIQPDESVALFNLGVIFAEQGMLAQAKIIYLQLLKVQPHSFEGHYNIGIIYLIERNKQAALSHFKEAGRLQPENEIIAYLRAFLAEESNQQCIPLIYTRSLFNTYADHYDQHMQQGLHYQVPQQLYEAIKENVDMQTGQWDIVDLGCGTGLCAMPFQAVKHFLLGVDIAENMLQEAKKKKIYDALLHEEIEDFLINNKQRFDLVLAGDVLNYKGELSVLFAGVQRALRIGGYFAFTAECGDQDFILTDTGRFTHSKDYLELLILNQRWECLCYKAIDLRTQANMPVRGHLYVLRK